MALSTPRPGRGALLWAVGALGISVVLTLSAQSSGTDWPQFRGVGASGVAPDAAAPPAAWTLAPANP